MQLITYVALVLGAFSAYAGDIRSMYEGESGVTCSAYNRAAVLYWKRKGGDWIDRNGTKWGTVPFATARYGPRTMVDVTGIGDKLFLRLSIGARFGSRESSTPPKLHLTLSDGSNRTLLPIADSSIDCTTLHGIGKRGTLTQYSVIQFPALPAHTRAVLELTGLFATAQLVTLSVYRMSVPIDPVGARTTGFAGEYFQDRSICHDPRVIYCETWDENPQDWWKKTNGRYRLNMPYRWIESNGIKFHPDWVYTTFEPSGGFVGAGLRNTIHGDRMGGTYSPTVPFGREYEHLFFRYYIKFGTNFRDAVGDGCDGGKLPGFASLGGIGISNGMNSWSLRQDYRLNCDKSNPIYPRVRLVTYAYDGDVLKYPGRDYRWTGRGDLGLPALGAWYCLEGEVKLNTPGLRDGVWRVWVNGRLAAERLNLYLRDVKPPEGYGDWRLVTPTSTGQVTFTSPTTERQFYKASSNMLPLTYNMGIAAWWGTLHHGGRTVFGHNADVWLDQTVVATSRIGCTTL